MVINCETLGNEDAWLAARRIVGGSDAASVIGMNPYKSNIELWQEKTGRKKPDDLSDDAAVRYGKAAEEHLRELFKLDYPNIEVGYFPFNLWTNDRYPWAHASLDGWLIDEANNRWGVLEIKTATISGAAQGAKWKDQQIPQNYYCQVLHYLAITGASFAILTALLRYEIEGEEPWSKIKHYRIDRSDEINDQIKYLMDAEEHFAEHVRLDTEPPLIFDI